MAGLIEEFCLQSLPKTSVDYLLGLTEEYRITVAEEKKDSKAYLLKVVLRHLTSDTIEESEDQGATIFLKLYKELGEELKNTGVVPKVEATMPPLEEEKEEAKVESDDKGSKGDDNGRISETLSYHKLRQFKINGMIGDPGQKNCLSYSSLCFQIRQGESQGYTIQEIYAGVIKAIEAGNPFRDVLELESDDFGKEAFMKSLRSHFKEKDANTVFNELRMCSQLPDENAHKFACRCVALKKRVQKISETESIPVDLENLRSTFFRSIYTGLRQNNVRHELRTILKEANLADHDLLLEVSQAVANEEERLKKFSGNGKNIKMNKLTIDSDSDDSFPDNSCPSSSEFSSNSGSNSNNNNNSKKSTRQQKTKTQKKSPGQSAQNNAVGDVSTASLDKMTAAFERMSASNAQLTAEVNILKKLTESHKPKPPTQPAIPPTSAQNVGNSGPSAPGSSLLNPYAGTFQQKAPFHQFRPAQSRNRTNRIIYRCNPCLAVDSPYCAHCFKCGGGDHKIKDCPLN